MNRPKNKSQLYETLHFFWELKGKRNLNGMIQEMKLNVNLGYVTKLVSDIAVLLEGDTENTRYPDAFARYHQHYGDFTSRKLFDYCRYVCRTFNVQMPDIAEINLPSSYTIPKKIEKIINDKHQPF